MQGIYDRVIIVIAKELLPEILAALEVILGGGKHPCRDMTIPTLGPHS